MDIQKRLFRRPFTTVLWGVLVTAMALLLCVGIALWYSSYSLSSAMDELFTTVAVRTDREFLISERKSMGLWQPDFYESKNLLQEDMDFLESLDSVEGVYMHTLTGAYSPEFQPLLGLSSTGVKDIYMGANESYDNVFLIGTVEAITQAYPWTTPGEETISGEPLKTYLMRVRVQIEEVVSAHPGYGFQPGDLVTYYFYINDIDPFEEFTEGKRLLIYGSVRLWDNYVEAYYDYEAAFTNGMTRIPWLVELEGSFEDFLTDPENEDWAIAFNTWQEMLQHSLPVIGTERLDSLYGFVKGDATIVDGRMFTQEEYDTGAKVCILSESLAMQSGIEVGDTISVFQFLCENQNTSVDCYAWDGMLNNPTAGSVRYTELQLPDEEFTVIGLYRQTNAWEDTSYAFSPNTVFIPQKAQISGGFGGLSTLEEMRFWDENGSYTEMGCKDHGGFGIYLSVVLENGRREEFLRELEGTPWEKEFVTLEQGYEAVIGSVDAVVEAAGYLLVLSCMGWTLLLALYVVLYQGGQRKTLGTMRSLGVKPRQARGYLFGSGMSLAGVCIVLGTALSVIVMAVVSDKLLEQMLTSQKETGLSAQMLRSMIAGSQLPVSGLVILGLAQLVISGLILWGHASALSKQSLRKLLT